MFNYLHSHVKKQINLSWFLTILIGLSLTGTQAKANTLTLDDITQKAINSSYELKIAQMDIKINRTDIKAARADYYPIIRGTIYTEHLQSLQSKVGQVTTIGGTTVLPTGTRFQNSMSLNLNYNLVDFGARRHKLESAKQGTKSKIATYEQSLRDMRLKLIDLYTEALISYKNMRAHEALLELAQQQYQMKKQLYSAGSVSTVSLADEAILVAQNLDNIQVYRDQYIQKLQGLSNYTHEPYNPQTTYLTDIFEDSSPATITVTLSKTPEARLYDALIAQKEHEISTLKRQYLPTISCYSYYNIYGFDPNHWNASVANLSQRTVSFGLSMSLPAFDGFKNQAAIEKAQLEKEKLKLEKEYKLSQLQNQAETYTSQLEGATLELKTKATILNKTQDKLTMMTRLSEQKVVDQTQAIKEHMERIQKQVAMEVSMIQKYSALKKLKILAEG